MPVEWRGNEFLERARRAAAQAVDAGAIILQAAIKKNLGKGGSSNRSNEGKRIGGKNLAVDTGNLRRSIQVAPVTTEGMTVKTRVGTNTVYAKIHEFGGVVSAKGRALTIPISRKARAASARGQRPQQAFPDSFILKTKTGALIVRDPSRGKGKVTSVPKASGGKAAMIGPMRKPTFGSRKGGSLSYALAKIGGAWKKLEVLYSLVRSVRIPPRPYYRPAVQEVSQTVRRRVAEVFKSRMRLR